MKRELFFILLFICLFFSGTSFSQIDYSCDMESCGANWDNNSWTDGQTSSITACSGSGDYLYDNVYGTTSYSVLYVWNNVAITGHAGEAITVKFNVKLIDWDDGVSDRTSDEWGSLQVYYKTSTPSESVPGSTAGSAITSTSDCGEHSVTFDPGTTISNLYLCFKYDNNQNNTDNWIIIDDIVVTEACAPGTTTFYSKASGNLDDLSTWGSNSDGTGCNPSNFTTAGITYYVHNNTAPTTSGTWTVSGAGSKVVVGQSGNTVVFTAGAALDFNCDLELAEDGTLNLNDNNMNLEGDLIRSNALAVFNPGPSGTNTVTFDGGTIQNINVTEPDGFIPSNADLTFYDVVVTNGSTVKMYYKFTNSKKLNINDLTVDSGNTLHFISD